jgi:hypothetical protein
MNIALNLTRALVYLQRGLPGTLGDPSARRFRIEIDKPCSSPLPLRKASRPTRRTADAATCGPNRAEVAGAPGDSL